MILVEYVEDYEFKLAVIDNTPPEIHLIGDAEIHDFYSFGQKILA